jgi:23S rRNA pseudouridine1911/1915/1917 synthase
MPHKQHALIKHSFKPKENKTSLRLDQAIAYHLPEISREKARKLIQIGAAWVNNNRVQILSRKVVAGDKITLYIGREGVNRFYESTAENILYEDNWLLFYRKEPNTPSQALLCDNYNNIYAALLRYLKKKMTAPYLGMHHRLDQETSGVMLFSLSKKVNRSIHYQFKDLRIKKLYLALVEGNPTFDKKILTTYIRRQAGKYECSFKGPGKLAVCRFTNVLQGERFSLMRAEPTTGRTHQIRLQLAFLGLPVLGDSLYGSGRSEHFPRTMLHAERLSIIHPIYKKVLTVKAELFRDMKKIIDGQMRMK